MGHNGLMAKEPKIISKIFVDKNGKPVKEAKDADRIEVTVENPDGTRETTILLKSAPHA